MSAEQDAQRFRDGLDKVRTEVRKAIVGQDEVVECVLAALATNGHVLLEGMPGLGKTLLVRTLSQALRLGFSRIQFTPDMMPADVTGTTVLSEGRAREFRPGPIFSNLVLADEINRATPKTQSAMLEAMQERAVTVGGTRHALAHPFLVMATQNPIEQEGTYPLPEAQLDRFLFKVIVPYPTKDELRAVVERTTGTEEAHPAAALDPEEIGWMQTLLRAVPVPQNVLDYVLSIVVATHPDGPDASPAAKRFSRYGASPRGAQALVLAGKAFALMSGRYHVSKADVQRALLPALRHRVILSFEAEAEGIDADAFLTDVLAFVDGRDRDPIRV